MVFRYRGMIPPAVKVAHVRLWVLFAAGYLVSFTVPFKFGPLTYGWQGVVKVTMCVILMGTGLALQLATFRRLRKLLKQNPEGLCVRCEHPLPVNGQDPVTCTECGMTRTRQEHRDDWKRWVTG